MSDQFLISSLVLLILIYFQIPSVQTNGILNLTSSEKLLCYACKGSQCESIANEEDNIVLCNKYTQLCWAGFVDQQPYRTCASRYCTPSGISLDSDIRIESCCHSNLCNTVTLSWATMSKWYRRVSSSRVSTSSPSQTPVVTTDSLSSRTSKPRKDESQLFLVDDIVNTNRQPGVETDLDRERSRLAKLQWNASDPDSYGINWERIPYDRAFSTPVASISKLLVLLLPVLLVLLF